MSNAETQLADLKAAGEAPEFLTIEGYKTLKRGYLVGDETPRDMYWRVANSAAKYLNRPEMAAKFFKYIDNNWLCLSTPVAANSGTERGLPISCYGMTVPDSTDGIFMSYHETAMLTKHGGGVGKYWGKVRPKGTPITGGGFTNGVIPWMKGEESALQAVSQAGMRRGSGAQYYDVKGNEIEEFIDIRRETGDPRRRCVSEQFHHAVCIDDGFMREAEMGVKKANKIWTSILNTRFETGEPYICNTGTANLNAPDCYKANKLEITTSQLCNEIFLFTDEDHTFVCCLSSLNLARWHEWKDTDLVETAIWFLDAVMSEFIDKAQHMIGFEKSVRFARKGRALGLGVLGWHTLLQQKMLPFESFEAMTLNNEIFKTMRERAEIATQQLAQAYGEVEWTSGFGRRNTHLLAVAPTTSNSLISGGVSQGIEPVKSVYYAQNTAKGTFIRKNKTFVEFLERKGMNKPEVWMQINEDMGSVKNLDFLTADEKEVFLSFQEINQYAVVRQAGQRQRWIDQGQSLNLCFAPTPEMTVQDRRKLTNYIHGVHWEGYKLGLKGLYYLRSGSVLKGDSVYREESDCKSCEG